MSDVKNTSLQLTLQLRACGVDVADDRQFVYYNGAPIGSTAECADRAAQLAYSKDPPPPPTPPGENQTGDWKPLGVWALTQEEKGDAFMFLQLSVNKAGAISGAYANVLSGEKEPVSHIGEPIHEC
jgi:hypothetical protein